MMKCYWNFANYMYGTRGSPTWNTTRCRLRSTTPTQKQNFLTCCIEQDWTIAQFSLKSFLGGKSHARPERQAARQPADHKPWGWLQKSNQNCAGVFSDDLQPGKLAQRRCLVDWRGKEDRLHPTESCLAGLVGGGAAWRSIEQRGQKKKWKGERGEVEQRTPTDETCFHQGRTGLGLGGTFPKGEVHVQPASWWGRGNLCS